MLGMAYALISSALVVIVIVVVIIQGFGAYRAKMSLVREEAYRKLAEQALTTSQKAADEEQKIAAALDEMRSRLAAIEKILREVE
jgi:Tfp pilus assembly protein PilO